MNDLSIPRVGDTVKVVHAVMGAQGANGQYGVITKEHSEHGVDSGVKVKLENGQVWAIGDYPHIMLELIEKDESSIEFPEQNKLKIRVGDNIYLERRDEIIRIETVQKVTRTLIRTENYTYRIEDLHVRGQDTWYYIRALQETPAVIERWQNQEARKWFNRNYLLVPIELVKEIKQKMEKK